MANLSDPYGWGWAPPRRSARLLTADSPNYNYQPELAASPKRKVPKQKPVATQLGQWPVKMLATFTGGFERT